MAHSVPRDRPRRPAPDPPPAARPRGGDLGARLGDPGRHARPAGEGPERPQPLRATTAAQIRAGLRQWAEALVTLVDRGVFACPVALEDVGFEALWTLRVAVPTRAVATPDDPFAAERIRTLGSATPLVTEARLLALAVIDGALDHQLWPKARRDPITGRWPKSSAQLGFKLWSMAERFALGLYVAEDAAPLVAMQAAWRGVRPGLKEVLLQPCMHRDAPRIVERLTLPQLVCCVLPWWTQHELPRLRAAAKTAERRAHTSAAAAIRARRARARYREGLFGYRILVSFAADPWRIRNAQHARVGEELHLEVTWGADGTLTAVTGIVSRYPGDADCDLPEVTTKTGSSRGHWRWSTVVADPAWLAEALTEEWLPALVESGVVPPETTLAEALAAGEYAWFANKTPRTCARAVVLGAFRDEQGIATRFGDSLLAALRAMGVGPLPASAATAAQEGFAYQFTPHTLRTLWATYWLGVRGEAGPVRPGTGDRYTGVAVACAATGDTERTLRKHYAVVADVVREQMRRPVHSWEHPRAFDAVMDKTWLEDPKFNWRRTWRDPAFRALLPPALRALDPDAPLQRPKRSLRRRGRDPRTAPAR